MGYLDKTTVTVDAILTKRGRQLMAEGGFNITQFALADDEIDYTLFNENHPNGSQFSGEAIENMPLIEAIPDEANIMKHKLITLPRGTSKLPLVTANVSKVVLSLGSSTVVNPSTLNFNGLANLSEPSGYSATIADRRLFTAFQGTGNKRAQQNTVNPYSSTAVSETVIGTGFQLTAINSLSLFGSNNKLLTSLTIEGRDSGARVTVPVEINKQVVKSQAFSGETGIELR